MLSRIRLYFFWKYVNKVRRSYVSRLKRKIRILEKLNKAHTRLTNSQDKIIFAYESMVKNLEDQIKILEKTPTYVANVKLDNGEWEIQASYDRDF